MPRFAALRRRTNRRDASSRGAVAVEFALVSGLLLFPLLMGIIQYGLYFNDSISARQGIREATRSGITRNVPVVAPCVPGSTDLAKIKCNANVQVGAMVGNVYIKVYYPTPVGGGPAAWLRGNALKVCSAVSYNGPVNLVPMPNGGWIRTQTTMAVEQDLTSTNAPTGVGPPAYLEDTLPSGQSWSWCTAP